MLTFREAQQHARSLDLFIMEDHYRKLFAKRGRRGLCLAIYCVRTGRRVALYLFNDGKVLIDRLARGCSDFKEACRLVVEFLNAKNQI